MLGECHWDPVRGQTPGLQSTRGTKLTARELAQKEEDTSLEKLWLSGLRPTQHCPLPRHWGQLETTYFEKADASVTGGRCEVLVVVKVNVTQTPGMCKLLAVPIKNPRTAQVPAW